MFFFNKSPKSLLTSRKNNTKIAPWILLDHFIHNQRQAMSAWTGNNACTVPRNPRTRTRTTHHNDQSDIRFGHVDEQKVRQRDGSLTAAFIIRQTWTSLNRFTNELHTGNGEKTLGWKILIESLNGDQPVARWE